MTVFVEAEKPKKNSVLLSIIYAYCELKSNSVLLHFEENNIGFIPFHV